MYQNDSSIFQNDMSTTVDANNNENTGSMASCITMAGIALLFNS